MEKLEGVTGVDFLLKSSTLVNILLYLNDCHLFSLIILKPTEEELKKYTRQDCGMNEFPYELLWQNCDYDRCSGTIMFPLNNGYYLQVGFTQ